MTGPLVRLPVFDLDGTLLDTDEALIAPFVALGIDRDAITFGHVLADECARLGIDVNAYLDHYDSDLVQPFPGVVELVDEVRAAGRWAVCSNKHASYGRAELARLGWEPDVVMFSDAFDGPKQLPPVLAALGVDAREIVFIGDTAHDRRCATDVGAPFGLAGWNPRSEPAEGDVVLRVPADVLGMLTR